MSCISLTSVNCGLGGCEGLRISNGFFPVLAAPKSLSLCGKVQCLNTTASGALRCLPRQKISKFLLLCSFALRDLLLDIGRFQGFRGSFLCI